MVILIIITMLLAGFGVYSFCELFIPYRLLNIVIGIGFVLGVFYGFLKKGG